MDEVSCSLTHPDLGPLSQEVRGLVLNQQSKVLLLLAWKWVLVNLNFSNDQILLVINDYIEGKQPSKNRVVLLEYDKVMLNVRAYLQPNAIQKNRVTFGRSDMGSSFEQ